MSILSLAGVKAQPVRCDGLKLTFLPERIPDVEACLAPYLAACGASSPTPGLWRLIPMIGGPDTVLSLAELSAIGTAYASKPGTVKLARFGRVGTLGLSGVACQAFQSHGLWHQLLADLWAVGEHRVTQLDLACDYEVDASPYVAAAYEAGKGGALRLSRKAVDPESVSRVLQVDARGVETGTAYLGDRNLEVSAVIYDKRNERERRRFPDPGPLLRVELHLGAVGASLRDAAEPASLFHHYAAALVPCPAGVPDWVSAASGFMLEPVRERDHWEMVRRGVEALSSALKGLAGLSDRLGPYGRRMLLGLLAQEVGVPVASAMPFQRAA